MYLTDGEIALRAMEISDVEILYQWENDTSLWNVSDTVSPFSKKAIEMFIDSPATDQIRLMIDLGEATIGCADLFGISSVNHNASIGILVYNSINRGHGIAKRAVRLLEEYAYLSLEMVSLKAEVSCNNIPAIGLFRELGYTQVGTLKKWKRQSYGDFTDVIVFQKVLGA